MNRREDIGSLNEHFADRLSVMVDSQLITFCEFGPWADHLIETLDDPPHWILDLAVIKYYADAVEAIGQFVSSEPFEEMSTGVHTDEYIASLFLRYSRRELSWASFLSQAGDQADAGGGREECEYFYMKLNDYEDSDFAESLEKKQRQQVEAEFGDVLASVRKTYEALRHFRMKRKAKPAPPGDSGQRGASHSSAPADRACRR